MEIYPTTLSTEDLLSQLKGATLVIPSVSVGNVPQLATDLLIHNTQAQRVAQLDSQFLFPFASPVDYVLGQTKPESTGVSTVLELYYATESNLAIVQQRSPILPGYARNFLDQLHALVEHVGFSSVVLLDSNDHTREYIDPLNPIEVFSNNVADKLKTLRVSDEETEEPSPFTAFVKTLIQELDTVQDLSIKALLMFVYEGDNSFDAHVLCKQTLKVLDVAEPKQWVKPVSWSGVYGDRPIPVGDNEGIYA